MVHDELREKALLSFGPPVQHHQMLRLAAERRFRLHH